MKQRAQKKIASSKRKKSGQVELPSKKVLSEAELAAAERRKELHLEQQFKERKIKKKKSSRDKERVDCTVIRTMLHFAMMAECREKEDCFLMVVDDESVKAQQYQALHRWRDRVKLDDLVMLHFRIFVGKFEVDELRLFSWGKAVKLMFVDLKEEGNGKKVEEEIPVFALKFNKLIDGMRDRVDHEKIESDVDHNKCILSITVPMKC